MDNPFNESLLSAQRDLGRDFASGPWKSLRPLGWASVVLGILWLFGFGSVFAVGFGLIGVMGRHRVASDVDPPPGFRLCVAGLIIGVLGLVATILWFLNLPMGTS